MQLVSVFVTELVVVLLRCVKAPPMLKSLLEGCNYRGQCRSGGCRGQGEIHG